LFAGIFILSLGAGMLPTVGQAMIRDSRDADGTLMILTRLGTSLALASALTPLIATSLVGTVGWRGLFVVLAVVVLALLPFALGSPETLVSRPRARQAGASPLALALDGYRVALGQRQLVLYSTMIGCLTGALTIFFIGAPFLFIHQLKVSVHAYGIMAFVAFTPFILGSVFVRASLRRRWLSLHANILPGCALAVAGTAIGWFTSTLEPAPAPILLSAGLFTFGLGIAVVVGRSAALMEVTHGIATSSALITFLMTVLAAAISAVAGFTAALGAKAVARPAVA
jgi:DHA1 family bicyclomycin/chloramphenicol resistance-like MFS transporter